MSVHAHSSLAAGDANSATKFVSLTYEEVGHPPFHRLETGATLQITAAIMARRVRACWPWSPRSTGRR